MRDKLIDIILAAHGYKDGGEVPEYWQAVYQAEMESRRKTAGKIADALLAAGVVQEWVSVKDALPEDFYGKDREKIVVLVCTKSGKVSQCARCADCECIVNEALTKVEWIKNGKFYWSKAKSVTHWMPLPAPPKEE